MAATFAFLHHLTAFTLFAAARFQAEWTPVSRPESALTLKFRARSDAKPATTFAERALVVEFVLLRLPLTPASARAIQRADIALGVSATILLLVGLARVFHYEKGATYYFHSVPFIAKLSLFVIAALLSIVPTVEFRRWRPSLAQGQAPVVSDDSMRRLRLIAHLEMVAVVLILLCAVLMSRGIGIIH